MSAPYLHNSTHFIWLLFRPVFPKCAGSSLDTEAVTLLPFSAPNSTQGPGAWFVRMNCGCNTASKNLDSVKIGQVCTPVFSSLYFLSFWFIILDDSFWPASKYLKWLIFEQLYLQYILTRLLHSEWRMWTPQLSGLLGDCLATLQKSICYVKSKLTNPTQYKNWWVWFFCKVLLYLFYVTLGFQ